MEKRSEEFDVRTFQISVEVYALVVLCSNERQPIEQLLEIF